MLLCVSLRANPEGKGSAKYGVLGGGERQRLTDARMQVHNMLDYLADGIEDKVEGNP